MPSFYALMGVPPTGFDPNHTFVTSWILPPYALACVRLLTSLYCFICTFTQWGLFGAHHEASQIGPQFSYFTNLTYWGITFYTLVAGTHTLVYAARGTSWLQRWPRPLQALHSLLYTTIITFPFLVTIVFWAVLYTPPWFPVVSTAWSNVSRHGLNSLTALLEIVLPTTNPPPWLHLAFIILILALYLALAYVTRATQGFYPYSFLDPANGKGHLVGYVFGIAIGGAVIFVLAWCTVWLRRRFTGTGKRSKKDTTLWTASAPRYNGDVEMRSTTPK